MSTITQEPHYGAPQSQAGAEIAGGQQAPVAQDPNAEYLRQMKEYEEKMAAYNAAMGIQQPAPVAQQQAPVAQQPAPVAQAPVAQQPMPQIGNVHPTVNMFGQMLQQELPSIPDNNPIAELPQSSQHIVNAPAPAPAQPQYQQPQGMPAAPAQPQYTAEQLAYFQSQQAHAGYPGAQ